MAEKEKKETKVKNATAKKPGRFKQFLLKIVDFFKGLKSEFKKITWASKKSTLRNFVLVLVIVVAAAVVIGLVDWGLGGLFNAIFKGINNLL
ncbi:MAG: preprotein translocase subunit SecE [Clostridia bacterium]|nr:preprotein translocase subunit SecE [Clostridia bacterium]